MKKFIACVIILSIALSFEAFAISKNEPLENLGKGLDNIVYGDLETPDNVNGTNSKGTKAFPECTDMTKDDVHRGIARIVGGLFQVLTFWYPTE